MSAMYQREAIPGIGPILLVDDEPSVRSTGMLILENLGYDVKTAEDGRQALDMLAVKNERIALGYLGHEHAHDEWPGLLLGHKTKIPLNEGGRYIGIRKRRGCKGSLGLWALWFHPKTSPYRQSQPDRQ